MASLDRVTRLITRAKDRHARAERTVALLQAEMERETAAPNAGLTRPVSEGEPFPTDALPAMLADVVAGIVDKISVPAAVAAQSVLTVSALAAQPFHDVELNRRQEDRGR